MYSLNKKKKPIDILYPLDKTPKDRYNEKVTDAFLEGFNSVDTPKVTDMLNKTGLGRKDLPFNLSQEIRTNRTAYNPRISSTFLQDPKQTTSSPRKSSVGSTSNPDEEKNLFLEGFLGESKQPKSKNQDIFLKNQKDSFLDGFEEIFGEQEQEKILFNAQLQANPTNYALSQDSNDLTGDKKASNKAFIAVLKEAISEWFENTGAHISLHNTAHKQYPWTSHASALSPIVANAINVRIVSSSLKVSKHKSTINDVSKRYNVPSKIIGGIIFKEQFTKSLPDTFANIDTLFLRKGESHSTGLGAIFPKTARDAWAEVDAQKKLPKTDAELQYKLTHDDKFNIETIAAVLIYEAKNNGIISDISEASKLTDEQWKVAVTDYNGSKEYTRKVYEYLPYITELLD